MQDKLNVLSNELNGIEMVKKKLINKLDALEQDLKNVKTEEDIIAIKEQMSTISSVFDKLCGKCNDVFTSFCENK